MRFSRYIVYSDNDGLINNPPGRLSNPAQTAFLIICMEMERFELLTPCLQGRNFRYAVSLSKERLRIVEERYHIGNFSRLDYMHLTAKKLS